MVDTLVKFITKIKYYPHQNAAAISKESPISARPSIQIDSPSKTINELTSTPKNKQTSNRGDNTKDSTAPPITKESNTSMGNNTSEICRELF